MANEVLHGQDTTHPAGVIAKEDAAKGSKGADEIGPDGDGGFDPRGVGRAGDHGHTASRHDGDVEDVVRRRRGFGWILEGWEGVKRCANWVPAGWGSKELIVL